MAGDNSARLVATLEARVAKFERDLAKANGTARREFGAIEKRGQQMATRLESTIAQASTRAESRLKGLSASFATAAGALKGGLGGFAAALASSVSLGSFKATVAELAKLNDVAERTGASSKFLQEFAFGVRQSGGEAADAAAGMQKFSINVSKAAQGGGDLAKVFEANGVAMTNAAGKMRPIEDVLGDFAELVKNAENEQDQLNLATMAFGRSAGPALVLALANGRAGMAEMAEQARKAGAVLEDDLIKKAAELDDKFAEVEDRLSGLGKRIAIEFAGPAVGAGMNAFLGFLERIKGELEAIRNMDLGRLAQALAERTGPGYVMSWLGGGEKDERAELDRKRASLQAQITASENRVAAAAAQGLSAEGSEAKLAKLRTDLAEIEAQITRINATKVEPPVTPLKEIKVPSKRTVIPGEGDSAGGADPKLAGLAGGFRSSLKDLIAAAKEAGHNISILSGRRTVERQQQLWAQAVAKYGSEAEARKWVAPPGRSMHNRGMAADLSYAGSGLKASSAEAQAARLWAHQNAGQFGLTFPMGHEPWHIEPTGARGRAPAKTDAQREQDQRAESIKRVVDALSLETAEIGKTAEQQRVLQELQAAGVDLNSKEGQAIAAKVKQLHDLKAAQEATALSAEKLQEARNAWAEAGAEATKGIVADLRNGTSIADAFANALDRLTTKLLDAAIDQAFAGLFGAQTGGSGGGLLGGLGTALSSLFGAPRAKGGPLRAGRWHLVGEEGPELVRGSGTVLPHARSMAMLSAPPALPAMAPVMAQPPVVNVQPSPPPAVVIENRAGVKIEQKEERDENGRRRSRLVLQEEVSSTFGRRGPVRSQFEAVYPAKAKVPRR